MSQQGPYRHRPTVVERSGIGIPGKIFLALLALVGLFFLDRYMEHRAENGLVDRASEVLHPAAGGEAVVTSNTFYPDLLATGDADRIFVRVEKVKSGVFDFDLVSGALVDAKIDRKALLNGNEIKILKFRTGELAAETNEQSLSALFHVPITLHVGTVQENVNGTMVDAAFSVSPDRNLVLSAPGAPNHEVPIPQSSFLPCIPALKAGPASLAFTCDAGQALPDFMQDSAQRVKVSQP